MPFPEDPLWPGTLAQQAWGELSCPLLSQDSWPGFLSLPTGQSSGRVGGRKDASRAWSLFTNRKWLLPVHPREWCCHTGSGSQAPARKVPKGLSSPLSKDQGATSGLPGNSLRFQSSGSSAERFCNRGQGIDLGSRRLFYYRGCPALTSSGHRAGTASSSLSP